MSIRSAIRAALASVARLVLVPVELVVNGVRTVLHILQPARNTAMNDAAEEVLTEEGAHEAAEALAAVRKARAMVRPSEPERVRRAAAELREGRPVSPVLFDPAKPAEAQILGWMAGLDQLHLGMLVRASDEAISRHLDGEKTLRMPLLPEAEARAESRREAKRPLTKIEWTQELIRRAAEAGDDDLSEETMDAILDEADALVEANATLADFPAKAPELSDEDVG